MPKKKNIIRYEDLKAYTKDFSAANSSTMEYEGGLSVYCTAVDASFYAEGSSLFNHYKTDFFTVFLVKSGGVHIKVDFQEYDVPLNSVIVISPGSLRELVDTVPETFVCGLTFKLDFLESLHFVENLGAVLEFFFRGLKPFWTINEEESEHVNKLILKLYERMENRSEHSFGLELLRLSFVELLLEISHLSYKYVRHHVLNYGRKEQLVVKFSELAQRHHVQEKALQFYADKLFVTTKHLSETVKEVTGKTAGQVLDHMNLFEAKRLLDNSELTVSEVAVMLNFSSPAFFTKFFKRMLHISPREYRKRNFQQ